MPQLLPRRRRRAGTTQVHPRKPAHQIRHAASRRLPLGGRRRPTGTGSSSRQRRVKQPHDIRHAPTLRRRRAPGNGAGDPVRRAGGVLLRAGRRSPVKVDVEEVLDVALLGCGAAVSSSRGGGHGRGDGVLGGVLPLLLDGRALDGLGAEAALADERLGRLVVDRGEGGELGQELLEEDGREGGDGGGDGGFLGEDDVLGNG